VHAAGPRAADRLGAQGCHRLAGDLVRGVRRGRYLRQGPGVARTQLTGERGARQAGACRWPGLPTGSMKGFVPLVVMKKFRLLRISREHFRWGSD